jgi:formate dehydrogenase maturation protein FdhE
MKKNIIKLTESDLVRIVEKVISEQEMVDAEAIAKEDGINPQEVSNMCQSKTVPPIIQNLIDKIPENIKDEAKQAIKTLAGKIKNMSLGQLMGLRKQIKQEMQTAKSQSLQEQLAPIMIAGLALSPSLLIAVGVILLLIIISVITSKSSKGGSCNPGWWDDL